MSSTIEPSAGCIDCAMTIIGTKWTALILRDLAAGPKRYTELQQSINLNPRTLSQRLDMLLAENILSQNEADTGHRAYQLTTKGHDLIPILEQMASWGSKYKVAAA